MEIEGRGQRSEEVKLVVRDAAVRIGGNCQGST